MKLKHISPELPFLMKAVMIFFGSALLMIVLAGCASITDNLNKDSDTQEGVNASPSASVPANTDPSLEDKAKFEADIQTELETMREDVDGMQGKLNEMGTAVSEELRTTVTGFNREMASFAGDFRAFQQASADEWQASKESITDGLNELKAAFNNMSDEVDTAYEEFQENAGNVSEASPITSPLDLSPVPTTLTD